MKTANGKTATTLTLQVIGQPPGFKATMSNGDCLEVAASREQTPEEAEIVEAKRAAKREEIRQFIALSE